MGRWTKNCIFVAENIHWALFKHKHYPSKFASKMKTHAIFLFLCLFCASAFAQDITGKWRCSKELVQQLGLGYETVSCTYRFKKDGTMKIKIKGEYYEEHTSDYVRRQNGSIVIRGRYVIRDGKITSYVANAGVDTDASYTTSSVYYNNGVAHWSDGWQERPDKASFLRRKLLRHRYLWDWSDASLAVVGKNLTIGEQLSCKR